MSLWSSIAPLLITTAIGLFVGLIAGYLIAGLRNEGQPGDQPVERGDSQEQVSILRERTTGSLAVKMDGIAYRDVGDMKVKQYNRLMRLLSEVRAWLGKLETEQEQAQEAGAQDTVLDTGIQVAADVPAPVTERLESDDTTTAAIATTPDEIGQPAPVVAIAPAVKAADKAESKPAKPGPLDWIAQALEKRLSKKEELPEKSIAAQIDEILQEKLKESHQESRAIRLMELPDKGMVVLVGLEQYESVEDVPDEQVRQLIKDCVTEWEIIQEEARRNQ